MIELLNYSFDAKTTFELKESDILLCDTKEKFDALLRKEANNLVGSTLESNVLNTNYAIHSNGSVSFSYGHKSDRSNLHPQTFKLSNIKVPNQIIFTLTYPNTNGYLWTFWGLFLNNITAFSILDTMDNGVKYGIIQFDANSFNVNNLKNNYYGPSSFEKQTYTITVKDSFKTANPIVSFFLEDPNTYQGTDGYTRRCERTYLHSLKFIYD